MLAPRNRLLCATTLAAATLATPILAQDEERVVRIETATADCEEGQDCAKKSHQIVIGPQGRVKVRRQGDGDVVWLGKPGELAREALAGFDLLRGAFLGVQLTDLTPELRRHFGVPEDQGVLVASVVADSPAAQAGVEVGDILTGIDGESVASAGEIARAVGKREPGAPVELELWREGRIETLSATLEEPQGLLRKRARILVRCDGEECEEGDGPSMFFLGGDDRFGGLDCGVGSDGEALDCAIEVRCEDDTCTCTVNGEERACDEIDGVKTIRLRRDRQQQ